MTQITSLTDRQRAVLAHVVIDPDAWVEHVNDAPNIADPMKALADKVARWEGEYDAAVAAQGAAYQTRAQREASQ